MLVRSERSRAIEGDAGLETCFEVSPLGYAAPSSLSKEVPTMFSSQTLVEDLTPARAAHGGMLVVCSEPGCTTLTMGGTCVAHDPPVTIVFPRGRPFLRARSDEQPPVALHPH